ncbi:lysoplasmalogenase [Nocardia camponoti]|uniref:Lysoplasmalogenase n=1 Tax=Nocardia camponoti TaxID=1616106 RepID=A0A917V996_9NOCA|nr:lysoplasmalogenase [Nocardia camponoti]GGK52347.1 hypothetical protein GCM10011591_25140 [Nocardia camponoti]
MSGFGAIRLAYVAAAAVTVAGAVTGRDRWQQVAKPLLMPLLAVEVAKAELPTAERRIALGSLAAATVGDVLLLDPDDDRRLVAGASSFAVMQTGYSTLWARRGGRPRAQVAVPRVLAWLGAAGLLRAKAPNLAVPLSLYGLTLGTAATLASDPKLAHPSPRVIAGLVVPTRDPQTWLGVGALLFTISDATIVARRLFARTDQQKRVAEGFILTTYAAAQYLMMAGVTRRLPG